MNRPRIRTLAFRVAAIALATVLVSLAESAADREPADTLDGLWLSDGYGLLAEIRDGTLKLFEITGDHEEKPEPAPPSTRRG